MSKNSVDIVLAVCPPWTVATPHIGVGYLAAYLRQKGCSCLVFDFNIDFFNNLDCRYKELWTLDNKHFWTVKSCFQKIVKDNEKIIEGFVDKILGAHAKILGLSVTTSSRLSAIEIARRVKKRDKKIKVVAGGLGCYTEWERRFFSPNVIDIFVIGEGEETLYEIVDKVRNGKGLERIPGTILNTTKKQPYVSRPFIKDLDTIHFPTYEEIDLSRYVERVLPMLTSRGCIRQCAFCHEHTYWGSRYRYRSAAKVFEEINYHVNQNRINNFIFNDFLINGNLVQLEALCDMLIKAGLNISWSSNVVIREDMSYEVLEKIKKTGCHTLMFGLESGSNKVLQKMKKGFTVDQAERLLKMSKAAGIRNSTHILVGFPGEGEREFNETISFIKRNRDYIDIIPNVNDVHAVCNSDLVLNKENYDVVMPTGKSYQWYSKDGITPDLRELRVDKMVTFITYLGFPKAQTNLYEGREQILDVWELKRMLGEEVSGARFLIFRLWAYLRKYGFSRFFFEKIGDYLKFRYSSCRNSKRN